MIVIDTNKYHIDIYLSIINDTSLISKIILMKITS